MYFWLKCFIFQFSFLPGFGFETNKIIPEPDKVLDPNTDLQHYYINRQVQVVPCRQTQQVMMVNLLICKIPVFDYLTQRKKKTYF